MSRGDSRFPATDRETPRGKPGKPGKPVASQDIVAMNREERT
ncbi:MAG: hypothetical protein QF473_29965 [Planctomycetota bacterium]|nr:hypothetical protein [Planctomycetota bacterium]